jgi:thermosome
MMGQQGSIPVILLKEGTRRDRGKDAQSNNIAAAKAVADAVRSTLGPRGMDKMLVDSLGDVTITNDGVTILKEMDIEHPAAKMIVETAKAQEQECGDGTTTSVVLAGELLKKSESLIEQDVHPTVIANGFKLAATRAKEVIADIAVDVKPADAKLLKDIARTSMGSKIVSGHSEKLADIAVKAVTSVADKDASGKLKVDTENIKVEKKHGGTLADTELIDGLVIDKERVHPRMPEHVKNARIALLDCALEIKKTEVEAKISIKSPDQIQKFLAQEEETLKGMVTKVKKSGANVVLCQKGVDDVVQYWLAKEGILASRRLKKSDMDALVRATGGRIVSNLDDLSGKDLGSSDSVEEKKVGDSKMLFVTGTKASRSLSILVRGGTEHVVDEAERSLNDAIRVVSVALEDGKCVPGGGAPEVEISLRLKEYAQTVGGREQLAIEAFAEALEIIPWTLAENAGLDAINVLLELRSAHKGKGKSGFGVNVFSGQVEDMAKLLVYEPTRVKTNAIGSASEVANMILRIDDVIAAKKGEPPKGGGDEHGGGMPPGMGGMGGMGM